MSGSFRLRHPGGMTDSVASNPQSPAGWPAPQLRRPGAPDGRPGTAAVVVGVIGSIVGAITFGIVWLLANITLNSCRYGGPDGSVDVTRARIWLSLATLFWVAMPIIAGLLAKRADRNAPVWLVLAATYTTIGAWAVVRLGPWELCM